MDYLKAKRLAFLLLRTEALIISLAFALLIIAAIRTGVTVWSAFIAEMVFMIIGSIGLYFCANSYRDEKSFGRAPALLANLIALGVSYYMITGKFLIGGIPLALLSLLTIYSLIKGFKVPE